MHFETSPPGEPGELPQAAEADEDSFISPLRSRASGAKLDAAYLQELHDRVQRGEANAKESLAQALLRWLTQSLSQKFYYVDRQLISDAVTEALFGYFRAPRIFDARRGSRLDSFLQGVAHRKLSNSLRAENRRKAAEAKAAAEMGDVSEFIDSEDGSDSLHQLATILEAVRRRLDPLDREPFDLWAAGETSSAVFAQKLGITHLGPEEQSRLVNRAKDRFRKALRRQGGNCRA